MTATVDKPKRATWKHEDVARLVKLFHANGQTGVEAAYKADAPRAIAKLTELGLIAKPEKPTLESATMDAIDITIDRSYKPMAEPQRTLAVRYAIKQLSALLPKRKGK